MSVSNSRNRGTIVTRPSQDPAARGEAGKSPSAPTVTHASWRVLSGVTRTSGSAGCVWVNASVLHCTFCGEGAFVHLNTSAITSCLTQQAHTGRGGIGSTCTSYMRGVACLARPSCTYVHIRITECHHPSEFEITTNELNVIVQSHTPLLGSWMAAGSQAMSAQQTATKAACWG